MRSTNEAIGIVRGRKDRSAWDRGVSEYAVELLESIEGYEPADAAEAKALMLDGARDWEEYSYGGCSLIYGCDIAERLCAPYELRRTRGGELPPNRRETWLDVQARALWQACRRAVRALAM